MGEGLLVSRWLLRACLAEALLCLASADASGQSIANPSFESPQIPSSTVYSPPSDGWTFTSVSGLSGIAANGSPLMSQSAPTADGRQVAVIQGEGGMTQTLEFPATKRCELSFIAQQRAQNEDPTGIRLQVAMDGTAFLFVAPERWEFKRYSGSFTATAGTHVLAFHGTNPARSDNAVFIDSVALSCVQAADPYHADFVSQQVPASMIAGQACAASVTMRNTGTDTWTAENQYRLGAQNPQDHTGWGLNRLELPAAVPPNETVTFKFTVTAPATVGDYVFQWQMVRDGVKWFGALTRNQVVKVIAAPPQRRSKKGAQSCL